MNNPIPNGSTRSENIITNAIYEPNQTELRPYQRKEERIIENDLYATNNVNQSTYNSSQMDSLDTIYSRPQRRPPNHLEPSN